MEIGWVEHWTSPTVHTWSVFTEKGVDGQITHCLKQPAPNLDVGTYDFWRISGVTRGDGQTDWTLSVNFIIRQDYVNVGPTLPSGTREWHLAKPSAEGQDLEWLMPRSTSCIRTQVASATPGQEWTVFWIVAGTLGMNGLTNNSYEVIQAGDAC